MSSGKLIYEVKTLNADKKSSIAYIDAMNGQVLDAKTYGGLKGRMIHHAENNKLKNAKRDSAVKNP